jgi:DNA-binding response OmpR family regulator
MTKTILVVDVTAVYSSWYPNTSPKLLVVTANNGRSPVCGTPREAGSDLAGHHDARNGRLRFVRVYRRKGNPDHLADRQTGRDDKVIGLELGADDYVTKPFGMAELVARIRAVLRRANKESTEAEMLRIGEVALDKSARLVTVQDRPVALTRSEFDLLAILMAAPEHVFSRLDLLERLKGDSLEGAERTIDVHIRNLRFKIEPDPSAPQYVLTVFGVGYRFVGDKEWAARC